MKAYEIQSFSLDGLQLVEREKPQPQKGEVLVRVRAASLNYRDWMMLNGWYNPKQPLPLIPLSDGAGEIEALGEGVQSWQIGDRVAGCFFQNWWAGEPVAENVRSSSLGGPLPGMLAEYVTLSQNGIVRLPDHLSFEEGATLPCAALTAWHALNLDGNLAGKTVLLEGTGGVALFALQFAKMMGARVILTSKSDEKLERARKLGADETINYITHPDWEKKARAIVPDGVDLVVELGGQSTLPKALAAVRMAGTIAVIGVLSGTKTDIEITRLLMNSIRLQGIFVGSRAMFADMNQAIALSKLRPVIDSVYPFDHAKEAFTKLASGTHFGKIVVTLD
jgi:NADPH:quinone reductase-like Zn-dependent oxidoreductase